MANARFWYYHKGSHVKLTMAKGDILEFHEGGPTDEGYHYRTTVLEFDGEVVHMEHHSESRDCDGRLDRDSECFCPLSDLHLHTVDDYPEWPTLPLWQRGSASQRDYAAEAMGY